MAVIVRCQFSWSAAHICGMCGGPLPTFMPTMIELLEHPKAEMVYIPMCKTCLATVRERNRT